jgi:hypothetical protein
MAFIMLAHVRDGERIRARSRRRAEFPSLSYSVTVAFLIVDNASDAAIFPHAIRGRRRMANGIAQRYAAARVAGRSLPWPAYIGVMSLVWLPVLLLLAQLFFP